MDIFHIALRWFMFVVSACMVLVGIKRRKEKYGVFALIMYIAFCIYMLAKAIIIMM